MSPPTTMRALQQTSLDGPHDMRLITDAPVPSPGPGEVLIRVTTAGVNFADISKAYGTCLDGPRPPYLAGFEAAGEVVAMGEGVTGPRPARRAGARARGAARTRRPTGTRTARRLHRGLRALRRRPAGTGATRGRHA